MLFGHLIYIFPYVGTKHSTIWIIKVLQRKSHNAPADIYLTPWNVHLPFFENLKTILLSLNFLLGSDLPPLSVHVPRWSWFHPLFQGYVCDPGHSHTVRFIFYSREIGSEMGVLLYLEHSPWNFAQIYGRRDVCMYYTLGWCDGYCCSHFSTSWNMFRLESTQ